MRIGLAGTGRIGAFHAATLRDLVEVDSLVVADADPLRAQQVAEGLGVDVVDTVHDLLGAGIDAFVIAAATDAHADLLLAAVQAGLPTFCEKPISLDLPRTLEVVKAVSASEVPVQIGFQRRFDAGYRAARAAVQDGSIGWTHTIVAHTHDAFPPPAGYLPTSGGLFRDCSVHDFDILRFVTGREVVTAYAVGGNRGAAFFAEAGDVDSAGALLVMDDGTTVLVSATRYNGRGHDIRFEALGSEDSIVVGLDQRTPLRSMQPGITFPDGRPYTDFMDRFVDAYRAELSMFTRVAAGDVPSPCTAADALEAFRIAEACERSRTEQRVVELSEVAAT